MKKILLVVAFLNLAGYSVNSSPSQAPTQAPAVAAEKATEIIDYDWPKYANDSASSKYTPLDQINRDNMEQLQIVWSWDAPDNEFLKQTTKFVSGGFKSTPIKIGRTLYISTPLGFIAAIDAETGKQKWVFDTKTYEHGHPANMGFHHRGVSYYEQSDKRRVLMGTNNAFLWSLDADTGKPDKTFGTDGKVDLTLGLGQEIDRSKYSNTAAVTIVGDTVVLGSVISDMPLQNWGPKSRSEMPPGHIRGFDVNTGRQKWVFHSIPRPGEIGNETWENESWKDTGSTNVWTLMSADLELGYVYLPFGVSSNDWYGGERLGDNLFGNSIVCLDAATGSLVWYFQAIHHDLWDYDLPAAPNLVDITVGGRDIKALAQISKQGFVYVLDRVTGEPVWPIEERPVPASDMPGDRAAKTQPFPTKPAPFDLQGLDEDNLIDFTPELKAAAIEITKRYRNEGLYTPPSLKGSIQVPGDGGGGEWSGAAFDPQTSLFYIPSSTTPSVPRLLETKEGNPYRYVRGGNRWLRGPKGLPITKPPYGRISALNLNTGEYEWVVPNGEGKALREKITALGIPDPGPVGLNLFTTGITPPLLTKSLLIMALIDGEPILRAWDKATGEIVGEVILPARTMGAPMTYMINGKQYISVAAMAGAKDAKLITLALP
ncbi:MAG TPA: pyrroloquinoline quinone-dependent dehydrogenase [Pseudomonadales bacterium]|jgi:quinoprotein glucose dehydrogenase|nr:pyrroloquinoline quinone-dependent dehydrogenase [Pseudomonadales bacterium]MDP6314799.1 pyrroloquinoline quinone-dependent dehydrogenase [Pseudomonadales bacterium]MDP7315441.1 pyrroloquinoline quinone-dependent dehydrogenase [Pseudomonadales bacterium]MDP7450896.1 pyrroloquinoline quinone-dependent dehydrogenase [Arenicellales bacterium]HJP51075.1 pyrroloquinoline quinone-dependent dehydrogenase [Pseudomonadales bacterium]|tara:strand:+ start:803 stop:2773 length:1971 start_codon:yes stop_codon:yes gene_type:complete